ncbi:MAG: CHASE domain-containing protein [Candidatus Kapaibacteriota bacterium]|jgi:PAS domain S-box-containing protein
MADSKNEIVSYEAILKDIAKKKKSVFSLSRTLPAYLILLFMLLLSFFIYYNFEQKVKSDNSAAFDKAITSVMTRFQIGYNTHLQIASSIRGLYDNLVQVVRDYLLLYASVPTKTYKSILGVMSVQKVPRSRVTEFVYYVQGQGYYDYSIHPFVDKNVYYPIEFIIPEDANKHLRGLDISSVERLNNWFQYAIERGEPTATNVFPFRGNDTLSMFLIFPVYDRSFPINTSKQRREAFKSAVMMEIDIPMFFKQSLGAGVPSDSSIVFYCYQKDNDLAETRLFNSPNIDILNTNYKPLLTRTNEFNFLDKKVYIYFATIPNFGGSFQKYLPLVALGVSILLSFVFFGLIVSITTSRARAIDLAERMTRSQRRILESTKDIIAVLGFDGVWKTMNPASLPLLGYEPTELIGKKIDILFVNSKDLNDFYSSFNNIGSEFTKKVDYLMKTKNGEERWINWSFTFSPQDSFIYAIGRDITLEKMAEIEERIKAKQTILAEQISREASEFKSYFMTKFSHQLRNALTTIAGYHQILAEKKYDSEEEMQTYLELAINETQELLSSSTDLFDVASFGGGSKILSTINLYNVMNEALVGFQKRMPNKNVILQFDDECRNITVASEREELRRAFETLYFALINGITSLELQVQIGESRSEGIIEIQMLSSPNELVSRMITLYNENLNNLIEAIRYDVDDILLNLALFGSMIRMLNGQVKFETLGSEGNLVSVVLPKSQ